MDQRNRNQQWRGPGTQADKAQNGFTALLVLAPLITQLLRRAHHRIDTVYEYMYTPAAALDAHAV